MPVKDLSIRKTGRPRKTTSLDLILPGFSQAKFDYEIQEAKMAREQERRRYPRTRYTHKKARKIQKWWKGTCAKTARFVTNCLEDPKTRTEGVIRANGGYDVLCPISYCPIDVGDSFKVYTSNGKIIVYSLSALAQYLFKSDKFECCITREKLSVPVVRRIDKLQRGKFERGELTFENETHYSHCKMFILSNVPDDCSSEDVAKTHGPILDSLVADAIKVATKEFPHSPLAAINFFNFWRQMTQKIWYRFSNRAAPECEQWCKKSMLIVKESGKDLMHDRVIKEALNTVYSHLDSLWTKTNAILSQRRHLANARTRSDPEALPRTDQNSTLFTPVFIQLQHTVGTGAQNREVESMYTVTPPSTGINSVNPLFLRPQELRGDTMNSVHQATSDSSPVDSQIHQTGSDWADYSTLNWFA